MLLCPRRQSNQSAAGGLLHEHYACGSAHRRLVPGPLFTGACNFGWYVSFGGPKTCPCFLLLPGFRPYCHPNLRQLHANVHRLVPTYLFCAVVFELPPEIAHLPWLCPGRRCHFSALFHRILHR